MVTGPYRVTKASSYQKNRGAKGTMAPKAPTTRVRRTTQEKGSQEVVESDTTEREVIQTLVAQVKSLVVVLKEQGRIFEEQRGHLEEQKRQFEEQKQQMEGFQRQMRNEMAALAAEVTAVVQMQHLSLPGGSSPSYAAAARTPPASYPSNLTSGTSRSLSPSTATDTLFCTIDLTRVNEEDAGRKDPGKIRDAIEKEVRMKEGQGTWRCLATTRDPRNRDRVRITGRTEEELEMVKTAALKVAPRGARVLRDQLYPVKVDNANRKAVLEEDGGIREGAEERLGSENGVRIAKIAWLSRRTSPKEYGSMVVYVTKGSEAVQLLQGQYFHIEGESAYTRVFEARKGPMQCYNCQEMNHKAFECRKTQRCGKCAGEGHHHQECVAEIPKCALCQGPHEAFSKNCRKMYPSPDAGQF
jgi:hypothetical protein